MLVVLLFNKKSYRSIILWGCFSTQLIYIIDLGLKYLALMEYYSRVKKTLQTFRFAEYNINEILIDCLC